MVRLYEAVRHRTVECPVPGSEKGEAWVVLDTAALLDQLRLRGIPPEWWPAAEDAVSFMFALDNGSVRAADYPIEEAQWPCQASPGSLYL